MQLSHPNRSGRPAVLIPIPISLPTAEAHLSGCQGAHSGSGTSPCLSRPAAILWNKGTHSPCALHRLDRDHDDDDVMMMMMDDKDVMLMIKLDGHVDGWMDGWDCSSQQGWWAAHCYAHALIRPVCMRPAPYCI